MDELRDNGRGPGDLKDPLELTDDDGTTWSRLPPPAFPPGARRERGRLEPSEVGSAQAESAAPGDHRPADGALSEPAAGVVEDAFISPDDPIPHREPATVVVTEDDVRDVRVTGIGDDAHVADDDLLASRFAPAVVELAERVALLADALRQRGDAALRVTPEMSRFDVTLRAYCTGFLAARREVEE